MRVHGFQFHSVTTCGKEDRSSASVCNLMLLRSVMTEYFLTVLLVSIVGMLLANVDL
jgi:hypothetical protein